VRVEGARNRDARRGGHLNANQRRYDLESSKLALRHAPQCCSKILWVESRTTCPLPHLTEKYQHSGTAAPDQFLTLAGLSEVFIFVAQRRRAGGTAPPRDQDVFFHQHERLRMECSEGEGYIFKVL